MSQAPVVVEDHRHEQRLQDHQRQRPAQAIYVLMGEIDDDGDITYSPACETITNEPH
jgi:hypothetical protein